MNKRSLIDQLNAAITQMLLQPSVPIADVDPEIAPLVRIASELRDLPRTEFMERLNTDLKRSTAMATTAEPVAAARTAAAPRIAFKNAAKAIEFYTAAFGAREIMRFAIGEQIPHAEITIGDSSIMLTDEWPEGGRFSAETLGNSPVAMALSVPNVDAFVEHAVDAGATVVFPVKDQFYGRREGTLRDPFGYLWSVSTVTEEMSVEEMHRRMNAGQPAPPKRSAVDPIPKGFRTLTPYIVAQEAAGLIDFVKQAFGAEETFRTIGGAGGIHAEMRVGDSMLMMGGGGPGLKWSGKSKQFGFHYYVPDCDTTYKRALEAGATSITEPVDQPYGERSATVRDAAGNFWYIATYHGDNYKWEGAPDIQPSLHPLRAEPVIDFLKRAFNAEELGRHADSARGDSSRDAENRKLPSGNGRGARPVSADAGHVLPLCAELRRSLSAGGRRGRQVHHGAHRPSLRRPQRCSKRCVRQRVVDCNPH